MRSRSNAADAKTSENRIWFEIGAAGAEGKGRCAEPSSCHHNERSSSCSILIILLPTGTHVITSAARSSALKKEVWL